MAYMKPRNLDEFAPLMLNSDVRFRQQLSSDLVNYLAEEDNSIECDDIGRIVDDLIQWIDSNNFKVSQNGLECLTFICDRLGSDFWPYLSVVLPHVLDRLGDQKETVRDKARAFILKLLECNAIQGQQLLDRLSECFSSKNAKVREEVLRCLINLLTEIQDNSVTFNKIIPNITKLLSDPVPSVRELTSLTLVEIYRHVGDRLTQDIRKKNLVPTAKLPTLLAKFDEIKNRGELLPTALVASIDVNFDEPDRAVKTEKKQFSGSASSLVSTVTRKAPVSAMSASYHATQSAVPGGVDEQSFHKLMEDVPNLQIYSGKQVNDLMKDVRETLGNASKPWNKRVEALKKLRALLMIGGHQYEEFHQNLRLLEPPLETAVNDLRSQVVREACVTLAYLSQCLQLKLELRNLLPHLINLIQNSAKVVATSSTLALKHILVHTQSGKLLPILTQHAMTSKSKEIRKVLLELLGMVIRTWPSGVLERHMPVLIEALKKGIVDADNTARIHSREAYWMVKERFPTAADQLFRSLDQNYQRQLQNSSGGDHISSSSSSNSLNQMPIAKITSSVSGSIENISGATLKRAPSLPRTYRQRSGIPVLSRDNSSHNGFAASPRVAPSNVRSYTSIDLQAAQRAKARTQYAAMTRQKATSNTTSLRRNSLSDARPVRNVPKTSTNTKIPDLLRTGRTRSRPLGGSISQPTSRSVSPSVRMGGPAYTPYTRYGQPPVNSVEDPRRKRAVTGIPRSTSASRDHSRETSPSRSQTSRIYAGFAYRNTPNSMIQGAGHHRPPISPHRPPVLTQKILQQSREAENAIAAAFSCDDPIPDSSMHSGRMNAPRKHNRSIDNPSDDSEASSVCSERSFDSYRRPSDSYSLSGSHSKLTKDYLEIKDINEIIRLCGSNNWAERKEGLGGLINYFNDDNMLTQTQLTRLTEIVPKLFDPNTKVITMFLDALNLLLMVHADDLHDWLYVLLQRIFNKLATDLLASIYKKIENTLDVIMHHFPNDLQLRCVFRYLNDVTQRPASKVKISILVYLIGLLKVSQSFMIDDVAQVASPRGLTTQQFVARAVEKIATFTEDKKSTDVQQAARNALIAMFNCNAPEFTQLMCGLSSQAQAAINPIWASLREASTSATGTPRANRSLDDVNIGEDIHVSLRNTTAEIQNYSFDGNATNLHGTPTRTDSPSQDSGISQVSTGAISNQLHQFRTTTPTQTPTLGNGGIYNQHRDEQKLGQIAKYYSNTGMNENGGGTTSTDGRFNGGGTIGTNGRVYAGVSEAIEDAKHISERDVVDVILSWDNSTAASQPNAATVTAKRTTLDNLRLLIRAGRTKAISEHFKVILKNLIWILTHISVEQLQVSILNVFAAMAESAELDEEFNQFRELIVLEVLRAHNQTGVMATRAAERAAASMTKIPLNCIVGVVTSTIISTNETLVIAGAIKMLMCMVQVNGKNQLTPHLVNAIVPQLVTCYNHQESAIRKCAVFCMVAIHRVVGEDALKPYLHELSDSKVKLLQVYIERSQVLVSNSGTCSPGTIIPNSTDGP